jgi:hypothetical protein
MQRTLQRNLGRVDNSDVYRHIQAFLWQETPKSKMSEKECKDLSGDLITFASKHMVNISTYSGMMDKIINKLEATERGKEVGETTGLPKDVVESILQQYM